MNCLVLENKLKETLDIENIDMMLGNFSENSPVYGHEIERSDIEAVAAGLQETTNTPGKDFRFVK